MSDPNRLAPPVVPEFAENTPEQLAIAAASVASPEVAAVQLPELRTVVQNAMTGAAFQGEKRQIERVGNILAWRYFGQPGDDLPDGLAVTPWAKNSAYLSVELEPDKQVSYLQFTQICKRLDGYGLDTVTRAVAGDVAARQTELEQHLADVITQTPLCQLLRSFSMQAPTKDIEMPLDDITKASYLSAIRERLGADALEHVRERTPEEIARQFSGLFALRQASYPLELATQLRRQKQPVMSDALHRARKHFADAFVRTYADQLTKNDTPEAYERQRQRLMSGRMSFQGRYTMMRLKPEQLADFLGDDIQILSPLDRLLSVGLLEKVLPGLYDANHNKSATYDAFLDEAVKAVSQTYAKELTHIGFEHFQNLNDSPALLPYFMRPNAVLVDRISRSAEPFPVPEDSISRISSLDKLQAEQATTIGAILYGNPGVVRVIGLQEQQPRGNHPADVDLLIQLDDPEDMYRLFDPDIPGYTLVSREGQQFGFKKAEVDPYEEDGTLLPGDFKALSKALQKCGLFMPEFDESGLTATAFAEVLSERTRFPKPSHKALSWDHSRRLPRAYTLNDFNDLCRFITKKQFWGQCTGSHSFATLMLRELLPGGKQAITAADGYIISPYSTRITWIAHRQTVVNLAGKTRIIDATSKEREAFIDTAAPKQLFAKRGILDSTVTVTYSEAENHIPEPRRKPKAEQIKPPEPPAPKPQAEEIPVAERVTGIHDSLTMQLAQVLGTVTPERLYKTVVALPDGVDPIKRTLQFSLRARSGSATSEDAAELLRYLTVYRNTTPQQRDRVGVESYSDSLVDMLALTVTKLQRYVAEPAEEVPAYEQP